jgi:hypothetical protein
VYLEQYEGCNVFILKFLSSWLHSPLSLYGTHFYGTKKQNECLEGTVPSDFFHTTLLTNGGSLTGKSLTVFKAYRSTVDAHLLFLGK